MTPAAVEQEPARLGALERVERLCDEGSLRVIRSEASSRPGGCTTCAT